MQTRYSQRVRVDCSVIFCGESGIGEGRIVNLSLPGCLLESSQRISSGDYVQLRLFLPDQQAPLQVSLAAVRWVDGSRVGLEFIRTSQNEQLRLEHLVRRQSDPIAAAMGRKEIVAIRCPGVVPACRVRPIKSSPRRDSEHA
jgi:hypothetical protein